MELYTFPKRGELRKLLQTVWPSVACEGLIDQVIRLAGKQVSPGGLVVVLCLSIEDFVATTKRSEEYRAAAYATLAVVIRTLVTDQQQRCLALNEYVATLWRLQRLQSR